MMIWGHSATCAIREIRPSSAVTAASRRNIGIVVGGAAALHGAVFLLFALFVFWGWLGRLQLDLSLPPEETAEELTIVIEQEESPEVPRPQDSTTAEAEPSAAKPPEQTAAAIPMPTVQGIRYVRTDGTEPSAEPPPAGSARFISDRNSRAATEEPPDPNGAKGMPSQKGENGPVLDLVNRDFADGQIKEATRLRTGEGESQPPPPASAPDPVAQSAQAEPPAAAPNEAPPEPAPQTKPAESMNDLAVSDPDGTTAATAPAVEEKPPEPSIREPEWKNLFPKTPKAKVVKEEQPKPMMQPQTPGSGTPGQAKGTDEKAFQTYTRKNALRGTVTNRGKTAVDAADTPMGRYMAGISAAVSKQFHPACARNRDRLSYGVVQVEFDVNAKGVPENLRIAPGTSGNAAMKDVVLGVILESKLPSIPPQLNDYLIGGRLHISYGFVFH